MRINRKWWNISKSRS